MKLTPAILIAGTGCSATAAATWLPHLQAACDRFEINTRARVACFLATIGVESAGLTAVVENLNYSAQGLLATWPGHFTAETAAKCARNPEAIANLVYAGRMGNGLPASCDGWTYRGRGLIQITGRNGYAAAGKGLSLDLLNHPELLEQPANAALSAAWFWATNGCNPLADAGDIVDITRKINGTTPCSANQGPLRIARQAAALKAIPA
jgi:putative chitinase